MAICKIPVYAYFGTEQIPMNYAFIKDQALFEKFKTMQSQTPGTIYEVSGQAAMEPIKIINNWFGSQILNTQLPFYLGLTGAEGGDYTDFIEGFNRLGIYPNFIQPANHDLTITECVGVNGTEIHDARLGGVTTSLGVDTRIDMYWGMFSYNSAYANADSNTMGVNINIPIFPEDIFTSTGINVELLDYLETHDNIPTISILVGFKLSDMSCTLVRINGVYQTPAVWVKSALIDFNPTGAIIQDIDTYNPYGYTGISEEGGNDGTLLPGGLDAVDPAEVPDPLGLSAADLGFITMYNPSAAQLQALSAFLWSNQFDLNTYKKLFSDPMQSIIGLAIVPVQPPTGGAKNVTFGTIDSGISMTTISNNFTQLDCGWVALEKYVGCFMDNDPYTKIQIYLPFIGFRQLSADDLIGGEIHVVYNIDVLTGACACFIEHSERGVMYSYNGSCITNVPLTSINFSGAIQNAVTTIGSAVGMAAGMATGAAPITAMSAVGLMTSAANTALNSKPQVQRSGNLGGSAGIMSIMTPYVIIERPRLSVPNYVEHFAGQCSNITMNLGNCKGFTLCEYVHLDGIAATSEEILEIESLLKAGVIL